MFRGSIVTTCLKRKKSSAKSHQHLVNQNISSKRIRIRIESILLKFLTFANPLLEQLIQPLCPLQWRGVAHAFHNDTLGRLDDVY